jgi:hypothetical protein
VLISRFLLYHHPCYFDLIYPGKQIACHCRMIDILTG